MCLAVVSYRQNESFPLILAANRDEDFDRPTGAAEFWTDDPSILAGRDLRGGGTWLGVSRSGRFAAVTNYREGIRLRDAASTSGPAGTAKRSRGLLVTDWLKADADQTAVEFLSRVEDAASEYNGFNLLIGDLDGLFYFSNRGGGGQALAPGLYGLSNHLLDTPWPKVTRAKSQIAGCVESKCLPIDDMFEVLADETPAADDQLPDTGVGVVLERLLSPIFIRAKTYGTRSSTIVVIDSEHTVRFIERTFASGRTSDVDVRFRATRLPP